MNISPLRWTPQDGWTLPLAEWPAAPDLVLYFGARELLAQADGPHLQLALHYPSAVCAGCSTSGEIHGSSVTDDDVAALCIKFAHTRVRAEAIVVHKADDSFAAAAELGRRLASPELRHILVLSDGLVVNGTSLAAGFRTSLPAHVHVTGGLAGDGSRFQQTVVGLGADVASGRVVAIGFYGSHLHITHGSAGGWEPFGPRRLVTHAEGNVLYTLDDQPALALYKRYLGERAAGLPATGLLFPLHLLASRDADQGLVRTILAVDEAKQSLTFAGDIPQGHYVRLMKASCDALVGGAESAARAARTSDTASIRFAVLVSCVGRRLVMGQRVEEEVEAVLAQLGPGTYAAGFYSYGEIFPSGLVHSCDLHNQTMTLTVFAEETPLS
jgi:hypothetical protein